MKKFIEFLRKLFYVAPEQVVFPEVPAEHIRTVQFTEPEVPERNLCVSVFNTTVPGTCGVVLTETSPLSTADEPNAAVPEKKPKKKRGRPKKKKVTE